MKEKLVRFMYGRNGVDQFSRFLVYAALVCIVLDIFLSGGVFYGIGIVLIVYGYFRMFSKNLAKRRAENAKFMQLRHKYTSSFSNWNERRKQSRDYCFFRCPSCRTMLRVPRGKGKIRITCRSCGSAFEKRT